MNVEPKQKLNPQRIHNTNRVRGPEELKVGGVYICNTGGNISKIMITEIDSPKKCWFRAVYLNGPRKDKRDEFSMADYGIIPYQPSGGWNYYNYLALTETDESKEDSNV